MVKSVKPQAPATRFSQPLFDEICEQISAGKGLVEICQPDDMPAVSAVYKWLAQDAALVEQYARARETQADYYFDEIREISDRADADNVQVARLQVDTRKWMAGKLRPKKYGDKTVLDVNVSLENMDDAELMAELAALKDQK